MKSIKNKKGQMLGIAIFFVVVSSLVLIGRLDHSATIGASQLELLKRYQDFEGTRVYTETAVRLSAYNVMQKMNVVTGCPNINMQEFNEKLTANVREYLKINLSQPSFRVDMPQDYDFQSSFLSGKINILGIGDDIKLHSPISDALAKLKDKRDVKPDEQVFELPEPLRALLGGKIIAVTTGPSYTVSGGANINIDITCDEYTKYVEALNYEPSEEGE